MQNLWQTYDDIIGILRKRKIHGKWCHSANPLSETVIGRILWAKNNWQPEWRFPKNAFEKWLTIFLRKSQEVVSRWLTKDLWKSYDELMKNLTKFRKSGPWAIMDSCLSLLLLCLLPVRQYGTVCLSLLDQLRHLLVLSAVWKPICSKFPLNWLYHLSTSLTL